MIVFRIEVNRVTAKVRSGGVLTSGSQNIYPCRFTFSEDWKELTRTAVFTAAEESRAVLLGEDNQCQIPWEVLQTPGRDVQVGVYGTKNGELVMPTVYASLGKIQKGAELGADAKEPTLSVYEQILEVAQNAEALAQSVRDDADNGEFDGPKGEPGAGVPEGGHAGEVLVKQSDDDWDTSWQSVTVPDEEFFAMLSGQGWVPAATSDGAILTDENGSIILW